MSGVTEMIEQAATDAVNHQDGPGVRRGQRRVGAARPGVLSVRLTADQLTALAGLAKEAGMPTSAYARNVLLDAIGAGA